jgi:hypothetical protein
MYKITLKKTWEKRGVQTNWIKYLNVKDIKDVLEFYKLEDIDEIQECN